MDEILTVLNQQLQEKRPKLLSERRIKAFKFLDSAYFYTDQLHNTDEPLDHWESKLVLALNYAVALPTNANRDDLRREIAYARDVFAQRLKSNPAITASEQRIFEIVDQFSLASEVA